VIGRHHLGVDAVFPTTSQWGLWRDSISSDSAIATFLSPLGRIS
jgi:hypothetical protein